MASPDELLRLIADFSLGALPQSHDPDAPLVLVRSRPATARATA